MVQAEAAAHQDPRLVTGLARAGRLGQQGRDAVVDAGRRAGREVGVQARQIGQVLAQDVAVHGAVDRPVEGPPAAVQLGDEPFDGHQVGVPVLVQEAEDELLGALGPHLARLADEYLDVTGRESARHPEHDPHGDVHGGPDLRDGLRGGRQAVGGHVGDHFEAVGTTRLGRDRVLRVESDHLQKCTVAHGIPILWSVYRSSPLTSLRGGPLRAQPSM